MSGLTFTRACANAGRLLALTGFEISEFYELLPHFQIALDDYLKHSTVEGKVREGKAFSHYKNSPLPTTEDKMLFVLIFIKQNLIQEVMGALFDMSQSKVSDWLNVLVPTLQSALKLSGDAPCRSVTDLRAYVEAENSPLFAWMLRNVPSQDQPTTKINALFTVGRRSDTQ